MRTSSVPAVSAPAVHGGDDFLGIYALEVDAGRPRLACPGWRWMIFRDALSSQLRGVGVAHLVRREAAPHTGLGGEAAELHANGGVGPRRSASRPFDYVEQRAAWRRCESGRYLSLGAAFLNGPYPDGARRPRSSDSAPERGARHERAPPYARGGLRGR